MDTSEGMRRAMAYLTKIDGKYMGEILAILYAYVMKSQKQ